MLIFAVLNNFLKMRIKLLPLFIFALSALSVSAQIKHKKTMVINPVVGRPLAYADTPVSADIPRPKLVVGIVVD